MEQKDRGASDRARGGVREYYGKELGGSSDLKTDACKCCCTPSSNIVAILNDIDSEITDRFYGCGSPIPPLLDGMTVLDLGCGTGRDVYIASKLVGENGHVIGVDMTPEQLDIAKSHIADQTRRFGYREPNVEFRQGIIEDLAAVGIEDGSIDVVISNCVINLSPEKDRVFSEIHRVLKDGGELYFSDVFADRRVPQSVYDDPVIRGECLGGAMYTEDFRRLMQEVGFGDVRYMSESPITIDDQDILRKVGDARFISKTVRAFKLDDLEDICEDYGQSVIYDGGIPGSPDYFDLDRGHRFYKGVEKRVCGNTASMCSNTRFRDHLMVKGDRSRHYGRFECCSDPVSEDNKGCGGGCC